MSDIGRIRQDENGVERQLEAMRQRINELNNVPISTGRIITVRVTTNTSNIIRHGLERPYAGYIVVRSELTGTAINHTDDPNNPRPQFEILFNPKSPVDETQAVSLWVF